MKKIVVLVLMVGVLFTSCASTQKRTSQVSYHKKPAPHAKKHEGVKKRGYVCWDGRKEKNPTPWK